MKQQQQSQDPSFSNGSLDLDLDLDLKLVCDETPGAFSGDPSLLSDFNRLSQLFKTAFTNNNAVLDPIAQGLQQLQNDAVSDPLDGTTVVPPQSFLLSSVAGGGPSVDKTIGCVAMLG